MLRPDAILVGLVMLALAATLWLQQGGNDGRNVASVPAALRAASDPTAPRRGPADADLTVVVFTDYQCPICRAAEPALLRAAHADGRVIILYKEWPILGPESRRAAKVALAADRHGLFAPVHARLMQTAELALPGLRWAVERSGGDWTETAQTAFADPAIARALARNSDEALALGLAGTPAYLIGPILIEGARTETGFRALFVKARNAR